MALGLGLGIGKGFRKALSIVKMNLQLWLDFEKSEIIGKELVVNGDFEGNDGSWWVIETGVTISNDQANFDTSSTNYGIYKSNLLTTNQTYKVEFEITDYTSGGVHFNIGGTATGSFTALGIHTLFFNGGGTNVFAIQSNSGGAELSIDNISVKEITQFVTDKSPNTNNAKLFTGKALSFDGANDYVELSSDGYGTFNNQSFTISALVKFDAVATHSTIFSYDHTSHTTPHYAIHLRLDSDSTLTLAWNNGASAKSIATTATYTTGVWYRVVATYKSGEQKIYVNNVEVASGNNTGTITFYNQAVWIGKNNFGGFIDGKLSDFQYYNSAWTQADVTFDYNNPNHLVTDNSESSIALSNLKGYWALSEGAGSIAYDSSGEGNNGAINGATPALAQPTIPQLGMMDWAKSTVGTDEITLIQAPNNIGYDILGNSLRLREHAFNLDGSGYGEIADDDSLDFGTGDFSIECWVKYKFENTGSSYNVIYCNGDQAGDTLTFALFTTSTKVKFIVGGVLIESLATPTTGEWIHIVGRRDGDDMELYIDTELQTTSSGVGGKTITNSLVKSVGRDIYTSRFYKDLIDDTRIYNRALSSDEVEQNYKAGKSKHKN
jgi:hypothetical protein